MVGTLWGMTVLTAPDLVPGNFPKKCVEAKPWHAHKRGYVSRVNKKWLKRYGLESRLVPNETIRPNQVFNFPQEKRILMLESTWRAMRAEIARQNSSVMGK